MSSPLSRLVVGWGPGPIRLAVAGAVVATFAAAVPAVAQPKPADQPAAEQLADPGKEAEHLFVEGREALKKGDLPAAADLFMRSQALYATPGTLLNLANVEEQMGKLVKALEHYEGALKGLAEGDERRAVATDGADRLRVRIPTLRIDHAAGAPADMTIRLDGAPLAASSVGAYQLLDPGAHVITTSTPGHEDRRYDVTLVDSGRKSLAVEPGKALAAQAPVAPEGPHSGRLTTTQGVGIGLLGIGLAGLGIGAVSGALAIVQKGDAATACPNPSHCNAAGLSSASTAQTLASVSTASFVVGLAGAAVGVTLVVVGREKAAPSATVGTWVLPGGAGVGVSGRF